MIVDAFSIENTEFWVGLAWVLHWLFIPAKVHKATKDVFFLLYLQQNSTLAVAEREIRLQYLNQKCSGVLQRWHTDLFVFLLLSQRRGLCAEEEEMAEKSPLESLHSARAHS